MKHTTKRFQHTCPHEAGTPSTAASTASRWSFNTRARTRRARHHRAESIYLEGVSTHVPARGGHSLTACLADLTTGFNTRARTRRARDVTALKTEKNAVSTHVPARGGHQTTKTPRGHPGSFNTRARTRRAHGADVSTHADKWFQHTCPREAGTREKFKRIDTYLFQHTCPREAGTSCAT